MADSGKSGWSDIIIVYGGTANLVYKLLRDELVRVAHSQQLLRGVDESMYDCVSGEFQHSADSMVEAYIR